jgi:hypothetical protein
MVSDIDREAYFYHTSYKKNIRNLTKGGSIFAFLTLSLKKKKRMLAFFNTAGGLIFEKRE